MVSRSGYSKKFRLEYTNVRKPKLLSTQCLRSLQYPCLCSNSPLASKEQTAVACIRGCRSSEGSPGMLESATRQLDSLPDHQSPASMYAFPTLGSLRRSCRLKEAMFEQLTKALLSDHSRLYVGRGSIATTGIMQMHFIEAKELPFPQDILHNHRACQLQVHAFDVYRRISPCTRTQQFAPPTLVVTGDSAYLRCQLHVSESLDVRSSENSVCTSILLHCRTLPIAMKVIRADSKGRRDSRSDSPS